MEAREFICADTVIVDDRTKRVTAVNLIDDLIVESFPLHLPLTVYSFLKRTDVNEWQQSPEIYVEIKSDEDVLHKRNIEVDLKKFQNIKNVMFSNLVIESGCNLTVSLIEKTSNLIKTLRLVSVQIRPREYYESLPIVEKKN